MSVKSFKFVSPGIFINEVDNSQLPRLPEELGPVIIGRAERGPAMVPVKIDSFSDFVETFGSPIAGGEGDDVWRQGNRLGPTYAAFAAQAYLKSASPITFVRLLGEANANASAAGVAGWKVNHAYGLFVGDTDVDANARHLAAVIYSDNADLALDNGGTATNADFTLADSGKITFADSTGTSATSAKVDLTIDTAIAGTGATIDLEIEGVLTSAGAFDQSLKIKNHNFAAAGQADELGFVFDATVAVGTNTLTDDATNPYYTIGTNTATTSNVATNIAAAITSFSTDSAYEFAVTATANTAGDNPVVSFVQTKVGALSGAIDGFIATYQSANSDRLNFVDGTSGVQTFTLKDTTPDTFTVSLDPTTSTTAYAPTTLTVGLQGISGTSAQATELAAAINLVDFTGTITASASGSVVSLVQDETGTVVGGIESGFVSGLPSQITSSGFVNGAAAVLNYSKTVFNFDENSKLYIRNILNTNPVLTNDLITKTAAEKNYWLGATFDSSLSDPAKIEEGKVSNIDKARLVKLGAALGVTDGKFNDMNLSAQAPSTPMVVSQYTGVPTEFTPQTPQVQNLFKIHALYAGEWEQKNFKISISDVAAPKNSFTKYGTFSVIVRDAKDTDAAPVVYERFSNCDLDPTSSNYIGVKIGDMKQVWSDLELRYIEEGQYLNQSRFIRVEVVDAVESGTINAELLPFGFMVPKTFADIGDYKFPQLSLRGDSRGTKISSPSQAFFGITTEDSDERFDPSYADATRRLVKADADLTEHTNFFSLDLLKKLGTDSATQQPDATYDEASMADGTSFNAVSGDYSTVLDKGFNKFTMPLTGGFDGLNITEIEPFCDTRSGSSAVDNYAFNSMKKAIDMVSDPEVVECNLMAIPGVANPGITSHLISTCENRADALAVIDIEEDYTPRGWDLLSESERLPDVSLAVNKLRDRRINSSYGCAYFPWVQVRDAASDKLVWMPPSVAALGTMASSAAKSELWFAPAGFTRGGLSNGAAGLPVIQTRYRLTSKHRDSLYEANINPIAQFPAEGIVIFGQKTLQVTPSALDRINVRRLMVYVKKEISRMAATLLFDQNVDSTWNRFLSKAEPFLASVKSRFGLTEYRVILDETTTTPELVDRNIMYAKVFLKPARAIEFIAIDFVITNTGASFDD